MVLKKYYVCRACGSENITFTTEKIGGATSCYQCPDCFPPKGSFQNSRGACNPRKMYTTKDEKEAEKMVKLYESFLKSIKDKKVGYTVGSLSRYVAIGMKIKNGEQPKIRDVSKVFYKNGEIYEIKWAK